MELKNLTPTSDPNLFVATDGRLVHRMVGQLQRSATYPLTLPNNSALKVYRDAPVVVLDIPGVLPSIGGATTGGTLTDLTKLMGGLSGYIQVGQFVEQLFALFVSAFDDTNNELAAISQQLQAVLLAVGADDYINTLQKILHTRARHHLCERSA